MYMCRECFDEDNGGEYFCFSDKKRDCLYGYTEEEHNINVNWEKSTIKTEEAKPRFICVECGDDPCIISDSVFDIPKIPERCPFKENKSDFKRIIINKNKRLSY